MSDNTKPEEGPRSFARFVELLDDGEAHTALGQALHELTKVTVAEAKVRNAKAIGLLTLKIGLQSDSKGHVEVAYDIATKEPKPSRSVDFFFVTPGGNLTKQNHQQQSLPLMKDVSAPRPPAIDVSARRAPVELADDEIVDPVTGEVTSTGFR